MYAFSRNSHFEINYCKVLNVLECFCWFCQSTQTFQLPLYDKLLRSVKIGGVFCFARFHKSIKNTFTHNVIFICIAVPNTAVITTIPSILDYNCVSSKYNIWLCDRNMPVFRFSHHYLRLGLYKVSLPEQIVFRGLNLKMLLMNHVCVALL